MAHELFRKKHDAVANQRLAGRSIDHALICFLFTRICEQRNLSPSKIAIGTDVKRESAVLVDSSADVLEKIPPLPSSLSPADTLGNVYEGFLRRPINFTGNGPQFNATLAPRKSEGVFYTPGYIVDYIVDETVAKLVAGKSPEEMSALRVLDPACGAGRFLLRVYDNICREHLRWFEAHPEETTRQIARDAEGAIRLSYHSKCEILANCIFGIDIDELAVEVANLSLYLKLMEDETPPLPFDHSVKTNIRSGNSLGIDEGESSLSVPDGFDVVLGNPPYGAQLSRSARSALAKQYRAGTTETAALMMLRASRSLTRRGGMNGFIVPKAFV